MESRVHAIVSGKVQGVFYRANTMNLAKELGIKGWVKNLPDGKVELEAEGKKDALEKLLEFCNRGPADAEVENVNVSWKKFIGEFQNFNVEF